MDLLVNPYDHTENEKKGYLFERWVVGRFPQHKFLLQDWRSDKHCGEIYPKSSMNPDLVFRMFGPGQKIFFAVECKWKAKNYDGQYPWAATYKRIVYNKFGVKLKMPIHVALGIGGSPDQPEHAYLLPFEKIRYQDFIDQRLLDQYPWPEDLAGMKKCIAHSA